MQKRGFLINMVNNLRCGLLLVVLPLLLLIQLCSVVEKTKVRVDKDLLCGGVKQSV